MPELILGPIFAGIEGLAGSLIPGALGGLVATGLEAAVTGAGIGAIGSAVTGGDILKGAEFGGLTGGLTGGFAPALEGATGLPAGVSGALVGAGSGALAGEVTGGNPLVGALEGGLGGFLGSRPGATPGQVKSASPTPGGTPGSAAATAAPVGAGAVSPDITTSAAGGFGGGSASQFSQDFAESARGSIPADFGSQFSKDFVPSLDLTKSAGGGSPAQFSQDFSSPSSGGITPSSALSAANPIASPSADVASNVVPFPGGGGTAPSGATLAPAQAIAAGVSPAAATGGGIVSGLETGIGNFASSLTKNPGALIAGGGLALDFLKGNQKPAGYDQLQSQADAAASQGAAMQNYLATGTLPPGLQASLDAAHEDAASTIRSQYAARGMSGSSAEAQDLQKLAATTVGQGGNIAMQLFQQGFADTQMSEQIYSQLMQVTMQQDQQFSQAVGNLASAFATSKTPVQPQAAAA